MQILWYMAKRLQNFTGLSIIVNYTCWLSWDNAQHWYCSESQFMCVTICSASVQAPDRACLTHKLKTYFSATVQGCKVSTGHLGHWQAAGWPGALHTSPVKQRGTRMDSSCQLKHSNSSIELLGGSTQRAGSWCKWLKGTGKKKQGCDRNFLLSFIYGLLHSISALKNHFSSCTANQGPKGSVCTVLVTTQLTGSLFPVSVLPQSINISNKLVHPPNPQAQLSSPHSHTGWC